MTSQEYWAQREAEQLKHNLTDEEEITARIEKMYRQTLREVQTEIEAFYARYASSEGLTLAEARKKVSELDMKDYEAKAEKYVRLKDMSPQANTEMKLYNATMRINRLEMLKAEIGLALTENTAELEELLGESLTERTLAELERQAGILGTTIKDNAKLVKSIVNASYQNGTFSERLWGSQVTLRSSLESLLVTGLVQGKNARELAPKLEKTFGSSKYAAERLLRTELARVQTDAQMESFKEGGYDQYMFITVGTAACPVCTALNGKVFNVKDMAPGENAPPMHPNCRCSTAAYMDRGGFEKWIDSGAMENNVPLESFTMLRREYNDAKHDEKVVFDEHYSEKKGGDENRGAELLTRYFGGQIKLKKNTFDSLSPDYEWNGRLWDLKTPVTTKGIDKLVHHGVKQIKANAGGLLIDISNKNIDTEEAMKTAIHRMDRSGNGLDMYLVFVKDGKIYSIVKNK